MYSIKVRILFAFLAFAGLIYGILEKNTILVGMALLAMALILNGYYKNGTVWLANRKLQQGKLDNAEQLLTEVKDAERLSQNAKAYYFYANGVIAIHKNDWAACDEAFERALKIGLRTTNDKAAALVNLATSAIGQQQLQRAKAYIEEAEQLEYKPYLQSTIDELKTYFK